MYTLIFNKSKSKYFNKVLEISKILGGEWDGYTMRIKIPDEYLLNAYEIIGPLFGVIQNWKSTKAYYNDQEVKPYKFIFSMHLIKECAEHRIDNLKNCWLSEQCQGWGCKKISNISYHELGNGNYKTNNRYWYNFGHFEKNEWIINKEILQNKLISYSEKNGLPICPYFKKENIEIAIRNLPNKIIPDDINYRIYYSEIYASGQKVYCPENIRHIPKQSQNIFNNGRLGYVLGYNNK
jgi:hypothetical protein